MQTVIVGVDGSGGGDAALEFAAEGTRVRDAGLRVVTVWELAPTLVDPHGGDFIQGLRAPADAAARAAYEYLDALWPDLGSVSHHVIQHARCPVLVIPHTVERHQPARQDDVAGTRV